MKVVLDGQLIDEDWQVLRTVLPADWEKLADETDALKGLRKDKSAEDLLRTLLLHIGCGYSLRETVSRARLAGIADMSDVALLKRLRKSRPWLQALASRMLIDRPLEFPPGRSVAMRVFDASVISEPGKTGSQWRLHYSLRLPTLDCDHFSLTSTRGEGSGEAFDRFPIEADEYVMADRGYCTVRGIVHVVAVCGAHLLVRCKSAFPFTNPDGSLFGVAEHVRMLREPGVAGEWPVVVHDEATGKTVGGRLCAIRKGELAAAQARAKVVERASRKQQQVKPATLEMAAYVIVFTTFPDTAFDTSDVLAWYRVRWQIELVFKRFKSIAQLGHLPKHDQESSKAWLYGKLFLALATERLMRVASDFSPWGYHWNAERSSQPLA